MEDTLRYFFSAIFQGIAAILTLGAMFYMNYLDKTKSRIAELEKEVNRIYQPGGADILDKILRSNIIEVMRDHYLPLHKDQTSYSHHRFIVQEYETIANQLEEIKNLLPSLIIQGMLLLIFSSVALFFIGYNVILNEIIFFVGILVLFFTFTFLMNLLSIIIVSTELKELKYLKFFTAKKTKDKTLE
jgi:hypothetical protein